MSGAGPEPTRRARLRAIVAGNLLAAGREDEMTQRLEGASTQDIFESLAGGPRHARTLAKAGEAAWAEYTAYVAAETPTFLIGHEPKVAKGRLSKAAWAIYDAVRYAGLITGRSEAITAFFDAEPGEAARDAARVVRKIAHAHRVSGVRRAQRGLPSPLD